MKTILTISLAIFSIALFSQDQLQADSRILTRYSQDYIDRNLELAPDGIRYMNFFLDNGYYITEMPGKYEDAKYLYEINSETHEVESEPVVDFDFDNVNIYKYKYELGRTYNMIYRIGDTGKVIVFYSMNEMMEKYNYYKSTLE